MTLNLSCGKCKAIQPFSGTPPTCEVCGWVCSTTNMRAVVNPKTTYESQAFVAPTPASIPPTPQIAVTGTSPRTTKQTTGDGTGCALAGCFLVLAFWAACALILIALAVWAWHYLFG